MHLQRLIVTDVHGREVLDSRGNPTVEAEVTVTDGQREYRGVAAVPSGASTGSFEAVELRDGGKKYCGKGVENAVCNINGEIRNALLGLNAMNQRHIDHLMIERDGTENKGRLGANAILGVSMANARACAEALSMPLYRYLGGTNTFLLPVPMMNILNGGVHADNTVDFQEFMIMPVSAQTFSDRLRICAEIYHKLKDILKQKGLSTAVGDEGGFAPNLPDAEAVLTLIVEASEAAGYNLGEDIRIAMDAAASELYDEKSRTYYFPGESKMRGSEVRRNSAEMIDYYESLIAKFPICSIEDGLHEEDWDGWKQLTERVGRKIQLVGDDLFVTNSKRLFKGITESCANAILVKVNQIGSVTEAMDAIEMAHKAGYKAVISHRSGETEDTFIADLSVAVNAGQIKTGAPCRSERTAKYNQLLRIEEDLNRQECNAAE